MNRRPEAKVLAASGGGALLAGLVVWGIGVLIAHVPIDRAHEAAATESVPLIVSQAVFGLVAFTLGWLAPRTSDAERGATDPAQEG